MSIFIFSQPIHSGKTTALMQWCKKNTNCAGILMPDVDGSRKMYAIQEAYLFEASCQPSLVTDENVISIGPYSFYKEAFARANKIIIAALNSLVEWLVIDEVGKLELKRTGFYPAVKKAIEAVNTNSFKGNLLLVVRDSLLTAVINELGIEKYEVSSELPV